MSSFCLCSDMITAEYLYSYAALSLCTIIVRNRESCKITVRFAMHRILADCTNSRGMSRACLKKAFRELRVPVCGRFYPNEGGVAGYGNRMRAKYTAKWGLQIAEMIFQTRSSAGCQISFIGYALKLGGSVHNYSNSCFISPKYFLIEIFCGQIFSHCPHSIHPAKPLSF